LPITQFEAAMVLVQLPLGAQESVVHASLSSQVEAPQHTLFKQLPLTQAKPLVHALPFGLS
jgi:hypothetical protein